jgi:RNA polymerase sigma factor (sigma-70 family)
LTDSNWIRKALQEFESPLMRYAVSLLGNIDRARDVVQETFLRLCEQNPETVRQHLAPWLFKVCRNLALDLRRKEVRMAVVANDAHLRDLSPTPGDVLERKEALSRIGRLMEGLSDNQREVLRLKFQNGLRYKEISEITGLSVSNVGFILHTAIKTLRTRLEEDRPQSQFRRVK